MDASPIVFGEALFDTFPDGRRVLGGAPFNVAWHLQGFGAEPLFVSRVGDDDPGREILERMSDWGMSTHGVQVDPDHPTGRVRVTIAGGQPAFEIEERQAYDFIDPGMVDGLAGLDRGSLLYHGSLAIRCESSREALDRIPVPEDGVVCDINLREPWWTRERLDWCLGRAVWIKLNDRELQTVTMMPAASFDECLSAVRELARRHPGSNLIVTRGQDGVLARFADGGELRGEAPAPAKGIVDTVGAGDAFSAVLILGILRRWERGALLRSAVEFAADVCGQRGAIAGDRSLYAGRFDESGEPA